MVTGEPTGINGFSRAIKTHAAVKVKVTSCEGFVNC
jgi:hypothetical protein